MLSKLQCCSAVCSLCLVYCLALLLLSALHSTLNIALRSDLVILFLFYVANHALYSLLSLTVLLVAYAVWLYLNPGSLDPVDLGSYDWGEETIPSIAELSLDKLIKQVSKVIGRDWKPLARILEFEETEIDEIEYREPKDLREQIVQFFHRWRRMKGNLASNDVLLQAVISIIPLLPVEKIHALRKMGVYQSTTITTTLDKVTSCIIPRSPLLQLPPPKPLQLPGSFMTHGLDLIAQESSSNIEFSWKGLKLTFNTATTFTVGVVGAGHIVLPDGTELVTALYYISFNTEEETTSCDVWMELQHCACVVKDNSQNAKLRFVVTKLPTKSLPYKLSLCTEKMSAFRTISSLSGIMHLPCLSSRHGYLVGIVKPWSRYFIFANSNSRSKYYLRALVHSVGDGEYEMHIVVVKKVDPIMQMIDSKYPPDQFVRYGEVELTLLEHSPKPFFQSSLTISSLTTLSKNWRGSFISSTTIPRSRLENPESYTESATLPRVTVHFRQDTSSHTLSRLECKIKLSGTASPHACSNLFLRQDCSENT